MRLLGLFVVHLADDLCTNRSGRWEDFPDGLTLESNHRFGEYRVRNTTSAVPRSGSVLKVKTELVQPLGVALLPILSTGLV